jgi:hypothetical protein
MFIAIATTSAYVCQAVIVDGNAGLKSCASHGKHKHDIRLLLQAYLGLAPVNYFGGFSSW